MFSPRLARIIYKIMGNLDIRDRRAQFEYRDAGHGYDRFGLHPDMVALGDLITSPTYERWFRVQTHGAEHLPSTGAAIVAANHSGTLPFDAAMLWADIYRHTSPPRAARAIADYFVPSLPMIGTMFARVGMVGGSRGNARALLEGGEMLMLFPEGEPGISKPYRDRYKLQEWRLGHCELAIRHCAPIVPAAIIGAEEQLPVIAKLPGIGAVPHIPITATPWPLPVRYHIHYGPPIPIPERYRPEQADDPQVVGRAAAEVKAAVQELLDRGLEQRTGVFQ